MKTTTTTPTSITTTTTNSTPEPMYTTSDKYYYEGKFTEITQNDLSAKSVDDNQNTTNSTINTISIFIDKNNNNYDVDLDSEIKTDMPIFYKKNNLFNNSPQQNNPRYSIQNVSTFSPKCYQKQPIHLCNDFKMRYIIIYLSSKINGSF